MASSSVVSPTIKLGENEDSSKILKSQNNSITNLRTNTISKHLYSDAVMKNDISEYYADEPDPEMVTIKSELEDENSEYPTIDLKTDCASEVCEVNGVLITEAEEDPAMEDVAITEVCSEVICNNENSLACDIDNSNDWGSENFLNEANIRKYLEVRGCDDILYSVSEEKSQLFCKTCQTSIDCNSVSDIEKHINTLHHQRYTVEMKMDSKENSWSLDAIYGLVNVVKSHHHRFLDPKNPRSPIWKDIVEQMLLIGSNVDANLCRHKWLQLKAEYEVTVSCKSKPWSKYIELMHSFLNQSANNPTESYTPGESSDGFEYKELAVDGNLIWKSELVNQFLEVIKDHINLITSTGSIDDWTQICCALENEGIRISNLQCQRKWDNLRSGHCYFERLLSKQSAIITWQYFEMMKVLLNHVIPEQQTQNLTEDKNTESIAAPQRGGVRRGRGGRGRGRGRGKRGRPRIHCVPISNDDNAQTSYKKPVRSTAGKHYKYSESVGANEAEEDLAEADIAEKQAAYKQQTNKLKRDASVEQLVESRVKEEVERCVGPLLERIRRLEERLLGIAMDDNTAQLASIDDPLIIDPNYPNNTHNVTVSEVRGITHIPTHHHHITSQNLNSHSVSHSNLVQASDSIVISAPQEALLTEGNARVQNLIAAPHGLEAHSVIYAPSSQLTDGDGSISYGTTNGQHITFSIGNSFSSGDDGSNGPRSIILAPSDGGNPITLTQQMDEPNTSANIPQHRKRQIVTVRNPIQVAKKLRKIK